MLLTCYTGSVDHTQTIQQCFIFLVDNLDVRGGLLDYLMVYSVLNNEEVDTINSEVMSFRQNEKLLSMLSRKTNDQFDKFLDALDETRQQHVRNHITRCQGLFVNEVVSQLSYLLRILALVYSLSSQHRISTN